MAAGLPIITTDTPGCNLTVIDNHNGFLIEPKSTNAIQSAIIKINNSNMVSMGNNSRKLAEIEFADYIVFEQILKIYQSI
jgi:glycosyltransferase involved in cell wall biosynthesis